MAEWAYREEDQCKAVAPNVVPERRCGLVDDGHSVHRDRVYGMTWIDPRKVYRHVDAPTTKPVTSSGE